jgi:hypothetical protein
VCTAIAFCPGADRHCCSDLEEKLARRRKKKQEQLAAIKSKETEEDQAKTQSNADSIKQMMRARKIAALTDMARQVVRVIARG